MGTGRPSRPDQPDRTRGLEPDCGLGIAIPGDRELNAHEDPGRRDPDALRAPRPRRQPAAGRRAALRTARDAGAELAVLPEMFNTGYGLCPDYGPYGETADGPTLSHLRQRSRAVEDGDRGGIRRARRAAPLRLAGVLHARRRGPRLPQAEPRLLGAVPVPPRPRAAGRRPRRSGRIGLAVCADMIYRRVWDDYRDRIDLAVVSAAWPDFADRAHRPEALAARPRRPALGAIPGKVAVDLGIPVVFANQCGETRTMIPLLRHRRSPTGSPARAASATAATAPRAWPSEETSVLLPRSPSTPSED